MKKAMMLLFVVSFAGLWIMPTTASSHREAPLISNDPQADNTDVYAFVSPDRPDTVTIIANYIPLEDDVTDIELRAFACGYGPIVGPIIEGFGFCAGNANRAPNNLLGDGVDRNERAFRTTFPYVATPHQGYDHGHHGS